MKAYTILSIALTLLLGTSCSLSGKDAGGKSYAAAVAEAAPADSLLMGIQEKLDDAFTMTMASGNTERLLELSSELGSLYEEQGQNLVGYWYGYSLYYKSILYSRSDKKKSEEAARAGVDLFENMKNKNSEDYALMALTEGFYVQFVTGIQAGVLSSKIKKHAKKAIELDSNNPRGYYAAGSSDFYTPEKYGGGQIAEDMLIKATSLPKQQQPNPYLPSWGKDWAYELLVRWYIKKNEIAKAKAAFKEGIAEYPDNYMLKQLAVKLVD